LGREHCRGSALQKPADNKNFNVRRDPADERRQRKRCKGHHENTTLAVDVAKSSPGDHAGGERQCVACYREFGLAEAGVQCASLMTGIATLTIELSMTVTKMPERTTASATRRRASMPGLAASELGSWSLKA
jgi:hypothetical protein